MPILGALSDPKRDMCIEHVFQKPGNTTRANTGSTGEAGDPPGDAANGKASAVLPGEVFRRRSASAYKKVRSKAKGGIDTKSMGFEFQGRENRVFYLSCVIPE